MTTVTPQYLRELREAGQNVTLLDVRTPAEFREAHVDFALNAPLERLDPQATASALSPPGDRKVYVICQSGGRSKRACDQLAGVGLSVVNVAGGMQAWIAAGLPVVRGQKTISLERQVRIAAGSLVLIGSVLDYFVHPYFIGLAAFIGAGLVLAGVTDTCGMGMLLARMPWNQGELPASDSCCRSANRASRDKLATEPQEVSS
jgi:rhodanese-related sulfurtransferase